MDSADRLARLNYINGSRLEAADLRTEQRFHIEVRRRLTAALFTPGIATGLEVTASERSQHFVRVEAGVAIDHLGREVILLEPVELPVIGVPNPVEGVTLGNFVAIEFGERRHGAQDLAGCWPKGASPPVRGAPNRIVHTPRIVFLDAWPADNSGQIVLGQVALRSNCEVASVSRDVRRYVTAAQPPATVPLSLEGEKDVDAKNAKVLRFHVQGERPERALLYLHAAAFSSLYYTELGRHTHGLDLATDERVLNFTHDHEASGTATGSAGEHTHNYRVDAGESTGGIDVNQTQRNGRTNDDPSAIIEAGIHTHTLGDFAVGSKKLIAGHNHQIKGQTKTTGLQGGDARSGGRRLHVESLKVLYDGADITGAVLNQLNARPGGANWLSLGDGTANHPLVVDGTGPIDLVRLGLDLNVGAHRFEFRVEANRGGQVQYNLYLS